MYSFLARSTECLCNEISLTISLLLPQNCRHNERVSSDENKTDEVVPEVLEQVGKAEIEL